MAIEIGQYPLTPRVKGSFGAQPNVESHRRRSAIAKRLGGQLERRRPGAIRTFGNAWTPPAGQHPMNEELIYMLRHLPRGHVIVPLVAQATGPDGYYYNIEYIVMPMNMVGWD